MPLPCIQICGDFLLEPQLHAEFNHGYLCGAVALGKPIRQGKAAIDADDVVDDASVDTPHELIITNWCGEAVFGIHLIGAGGCANSLSDEVVVIKVPPHKGAEVPIDAVACKTARSEAYTLEELKG